MFRYLKLAFLRQKRWAMLFLLTIFLPSVILSVFGLIGLRNERFRLQQQMRDEGVALIDSLKTAILYELEQLEGDLKQVVHSPSFRTRDYPGMLSRVQQHMEKQSLSGQFMVVFYGAPPWFPPFRGEGSGFQSGPVEVFSPLQQEQLEKAWKLEFSQRHYQGAISILSGLLHAVESSPQLRMELLSYLARIRMKSGALEESVRLYREIIREAPLNIPYPGTYLPLSVRFSLVDCLLESGLTEEALKETLMAFDQILKQYASLSEDQFHAYISLAEDHFNMIIMNHNQSLQSLENYQTKYDSLNLLYNSYLNTWNVTGLMKDECLPVISRELEENRGNPDHVVQLTRRVGNEDYLLMAMFIPSEQSGRSAGYAGIRINEDYLRSHVLPEILSGKNKGVWNNLAIYDLNGTPIMGHPFSGDHTGLISSAFDQNFPPWKIDVNLQQPGPRLFTWLMRSFYFWTLLVLLGILIFGMVFMSRIIAHEKEVLQLKEDFVSSVSHEFKTPIASIIALTERLLEGNVKTPDRVRDYYSVIANDASSLNHMVENYLDFSKMEEGKKTYHFEATRLDVWIKDLMTAFAGKVSARTFTFRNTEGEKPVLLPIDRHSMKLALHNLLDNAVKFSEQGSEIFLQLEKNPGQILIKCVDQGIGIPIVEQTKIFQKFYRGQQAIKSPGTGTGLGLAIAKQVAEAHGGEIRVKSDIGEGTTMTLVLPAYLLKYQSDNE
jgi:signal transduction histidine kinase